MADDGPTAGDPADAVVVEDIAEGEPVHLHKPKPLHGWRETLGEVGVIVIGIVIAILLEQGVEQLHWRREVRSARAALHDEMAFARQVFGFRVAAAGCVAHRLDALADIVERAARHEPVPHLSEVLPELGNAMVDSNWQAYRSAQVLPHFGDAELSDLGHFYAQMTDARFFFQDELGATAAIRTLQGDPARLGAPDIASIRVAIERERFDNATIAEIAQGELDVAKRLGVVGPAVPAGRVADICRPVPEAAKPVGG